MVTSCGRPITNPVAALAEPRGKITVTKPLAWRDGVAKVVTRMPLALAVFAAPALAVEVAVVAAA